VAGIQVINYDGAVQKQWVPAAADKSRGETALIQLGLDWRVRPPGLILNVEECRRLGGFADICGISADYTLAVQLAYGTGLAFFPGLVGRYREGPQQITDLSTTEKMRAWLEFSIQQAERVQAIGCSSQTAKRILDYLTWWPFLGLAQQLLRLDPLRAFELTHECVSRSPYRGEWQRRVRGQYPLLFWRPFWLAYSVYRLICTSKSIVKKFR
jgi:hypothetical protein